MYGFGGRPGLEFFFDWYGLETCSEVRSNGGANGDEENNL